MTPPSTAMGVGTLKSPSANRRPIGEVHHAHPPKRAEQIRLARVNARGGPGGLAVIQLAARGKFPPPKQFTIVRMEAAIHVMLLTEVALSQNQTLTADAQTGQAAIHGGLFPDDLRCRR